VHSRLIKTHIAAVQTLIVTTLAKEPEIPHLFGEVVEFGKTEATLANILLIDLFQEHLLFAAVFCAVIGCDGRVVVPDHLLLELVEDWDLEPAAADDGPAGGCVLVEQNQSGEVVDFVPADDLHSRFGFAVLHTGHLGDVFAQLHHLLALLIDQPISQHLAGTRVRQPKQNDQRFAAAA